MSGVTSAENSTKDIPTKGSDTIISGPLREGPSQACSEFGTTTDKGLGMVIAVLIMKGLLCRQKLPNGGDVSGVMNTYTYTHTHNVTHIHTMSHTYTPCHTHNVTHTRTYTHTHIHAYTHTRIHADTHTHIHIFCS